MDQEDHPSDGLIRFSKILRERAELQSQVKAAEDPELIISVAKSIDCKITFEELRRFSGDLSAPYFPWSEKGRQWRHQFFNRKKK